jgi:nucleoside-diphosphate-sugar epimerase
VHARTAGFPRGKPKLVVAGGTGQALSTVVLTLGALGYDITVIGRKPLGAVQQAALFARRNVRYEVLDVFAPARQARVRELAATADIFVMGAEPYAIEDAGRLDDVVRGVKRVYRTLRAAGYTTTDNDARRRTRRWPKRVVRIGSSPAEIPYDPRLSRREFLEDTVTLDDLQQRAAGDDNWQNPYFQAKVRCAVVAAQAVSNGLDLVTAAPTAVISWVGDRGAEEPVVQFRESLARGPVRFLPSALINAVPGDVVARGIMLAVLAGTTGEVYQLAGVDVQSAEPVRYLLRLIGEDSPPLRHYSRQKLNQKVRLLRGDAFTRSARDVAAYGSRAMTNAGLLWTNALSFGLLTPLVAAKIAVDAATGSAEAARNLYDQAETLAMKAIGIKDWQVAILAEMQSRRAGKVRGLNAAVAGTRFANLTYPSDASLASQMTRALRRQAAWLTQRGLIPRGNGGRKRTDASL